MEQIKIEAQRFANEVMAKVFVWLDDNGGFEMSTSRVLNDSRSQADFTVEPDALVLH